MQTSTDSTTSERVEQPISPAPSKKLEPAGLLAALAVCGLFLYWLWRDMLRERAWFAARKQRMEHFREEARRRHDDQATANLRERLATHVVRISPPQPTPAIKTPVTDTPKQRKIFKLYG